MDKKRLERSRTCVESKETPRLSFYIKEVQSFPYDSSRDSLRNSFSAGDGFRFSSSRASVDGRELSKASVDIKDIVRASLYREKPRIFADSRDTFQRSCPDVRDSPRLGGLKSKETSRSSDHSRTSIDLKEAIRNATLKLKESSSSFDSRLSVELQESPRLSKDAPSFSCDSRDYLRSSLDTSADPLRTVGQRVRESPRLSVDGLRESPQLAHEVYPGVFHAKEALRSNASGQWRSDSDGRDMQSGEQRKRVPNLVARLMGLEDLPDDSLRPAATALKKPSKESKILKGLLQYDPIIDNRSSAGADLKTADKQRQDQHRLVTLANVKQNAPLTLKPQSGSTAKCQLTAAPSTWKANDDGVVLKSPKHLGMEMMPPSFKQHDFRDGGFHQKGMPRQFTEAVLTVLKHTDETKKKPLSYEDMEERLRQLRLRSSLQEHKSLRQILEAMQLKGLLIAPPRPRQDLSDSQSSNQPQETKHLNSPKQILLPKLQDNTDGTKLKTLQDLRKMGSKLQDQVVASEAPKPARTQTPALTKAVPTSAELILPSEASIVLMKPIGKPPPRLKGQNHQASFTETMPSVKLPRGSKEHGVKSTCNSVSRPARQTGFGTGKDISTRFGCEESSSSRQRKERILVKMPRDVQSEPSTPRSPRLIALPQLAPKLRSSTLKDSSDSVKNVQKSNISKITEPPRRGKFSLPKDKEESNKLVSQPGRDSRKLAPEGDAAKTLRRQSSDDKVAPSFEKVGKCFAGPTEVIVLRNKGATGRSKVTSSGPEGRGSINKKVAAFKDSSACKAREGGLERTKEKAKSHTLPRADASSPVSSDSAKESTNKYLAETEELGAIHDHELQFRTIDGEATDQSCAESPCDVQQSSLEDEGLSLVQFEQQETQCVRTPRGSVAMKMCLNQEDGELVTDSDGIPEQPQPSPVSVLDGGAFSEDDISPLSFSKNVDNLKEYQGLKGYASTKSEVEEIMATEEDIPMAKEAIHVEDGTHVLTDSQDIQPPKTAGTVALTKAEEERAYVHDILVASSVIEGDEFFQPQCPMDPTIFRRLEEADHQRVASNDDNFSISTAVVCRDENEAGRRLLFDCVNDILAEIIHPYVNSRPWMHSICHPTLTKRPTGQMLVQVVWDKLVSVPPQNSSDDVCDSLYTILQQDLALPSNMWSNLNREMEEIGLEVEQMILSDLVDEAVIDLLAQGGKSP